MGVWIETANTARQYETSLSHPVWVCGLKLLSYGLALKGVVVTPCMGVWIETGKRRGG